MSRGKRKYCGHYYQQLNHNKMNLMSQMLSAEELGILLKIIVLVGMTRQQFDIEDGSMSSNGKKMKGAELITWLEKVTPQLSPEQAKRIVDTLIGYGLLKATKAGYIRLCNWAADQKASPTAGGGRKHESDVRKRLLRVREMLQQHDGASFDRDGLLTLFKKEESFGPKVSDELINELFEEGFLIGVKRGQFKVCAGVSVNKTAPAAPPPPP